MCGIVGYAGSPAPAAQGAVPQALDVVLEGLRRLEYRGYDSAGVVAVRDGEFQTVKAEGKLDRLKEKLEKQPLAGRYGLEAPLMDLATGRRNRTPILQLIRRTLKEIEPHARELGTEGELQGVKEILARGNGADRQLRIFNANRDIVEVVREIAAASDPVAA